MWWKKQTGTGRAMARTVAFWILAFAAVIVGATGALAQDAETDEIYETEVILDVRVVDAFADDPRVWDFDVSSAQAGCSNRTLSVEGNFDFFGVLVRGDAGDLCEYTIAMINVPAGVVPPRPQVFGGNVSSLVLSFSVIENSDEASVGVSIVVSGVFDEAIPDTWSFALSSGQAGCTNTAASIDVDDASGAVGFDEASSIWRYAGPVASAALVDADGQPCQYQLAMVDLPDGWHVPDPVSIDADRDVYFGPEPTFVVAFGTYPLDALAQVLVLTNVFGDLDALPATWTFALTSEQSGCSNEELIVPSGEQASAGFVGVEVTDDDGAPCSYVVSEIDVPNGWRQPEPELVEFSVHYPFTAFARIDNYEIASAQGIITLFVNSFGDRSLAPDNWEYTVTSTCLSDPLVVTLPARETFDNNPSGDGPQWLYIDVPALDADGIECTYSIERSPDRFFAVAESPQAPLGPISFNLDGPPSLTPTVFAQINNAQRQNPEPEYVPADPTPTAVAVALATALPTVVVSTPAVAPAIVLPAVTATAIPATAVPATVIPATVETAASYGFGDSLPATAIPKAPALALTGSTSRSLAIPAVILVLAGLLLVAISKAPRRQTG